MTGFTDDRKIKIILVEFILSVYNINPVLRSLLVENNVNAPRKFLRWSFNASMT